MQCGQEGGRVGEREHLRVCVRAYACVRVCVCVRGRVHACVEAEPTKSGGQMS